MSDISQLTNAAEFTPAMQFPVFDPANTQTRKVSGQQLVDGANAGALAVQAAIDNRIYPGSYAADPTTRPDGSAVQAGDSYFNSSIARQKTYSGAVWGTDSLDAAALAASTGAGLIGWKQSGTGAVARTAQDKMQETVSFWDYLSVAERVDALLTSPVLDHTASMQKAMDAAPSGAVVQGRPDATFKFTNLASSKALTLDFKGASLIVDPTPVGVTTGTPAIRFAGTVGTGYAINTKTDYTSNVVCTTAGNAANFSAGDWVVIEDNATVNKWDASGGAYSGRGEICRVHSISGGTVNLAKPVDNLCEGASAFIYKVTPVLGPKVVNIGALVEVDPGGITTGSVAINAPHLIEFAYCIRPKVSSVSASAWNLFVVHFGYCVQASQKRVIGVDPLRPSNAGHGYLTRFYRCSGGVAKLSRGEKVRHVIDFTNTYDCISEKNISVDSDPAGVSFFWHGLAERRCRSVHDTALARTVRADAAIGWGVGNTSFAACYDSIIDSPVYRGAADGIIVRSLSQGTIIRNPDIRVVDTTSTGGRGIVVQEGAVKVQINGGVIDTLDSGSINNNPVLVRDTTAIASGDVVVAGVRMVAPSVGGECVAFSGTGGGLAVVNCQLTGTDAARSALSVSSVATWIQATGNRIAGTWSRGVKTTSAPSGSYTVTNNNNAGTISQFMDLATGASLVNFMNGSDSSSWSVTAAAGTAKQYEWRTGNTLRWIMRSNNTAEAGSNAGSDFEISRRDDAGANLGLSFKIVRSTGQTEFEAGDDFTRPLKLGARGFLWVDSTSRLRIKATSPTSDTDGTVVGTQV